ncbi:hypothetical protein SLAV_39150 [Streptomyces lavendulae subsp. lavendulae]|uniref:Uncharacterized protein n=1 Tax=Streptomyces lavendulae subsp. lavendulae TaxID=58340 RepID=A0A2K8P690_STRLA|nr:hypothetical protein [Streptomyces lavendulae]ATZ21978.1 hypothetical protein SLAV_00240 [Streptomyces lavendulae subsp. lavendulae]ATZ29593.1 hypothetical protein SLAV_39150 [Streptomyces lavendulae subsp. lavendulae]
MRVTLTGVAYRDALAKDKTLPLTGKYALAVALTLESENGGTFKGYGKDNLIKWSYGPEMNKASRYYDAPWDGCIDSYTPWGKVAAGQPYLAISSMNISRRGGNLLMEDSYGSIARWDLPQEDTGTGTEPATKYATTDC